MCASVLIVDDAKFMRSILKDIFTKNGYDIAGEAENGQQSIDAYKQLKPDLVTMDIIMPDMAGIDAIKEIVAFDANAKVIVCSALSQQAMVIDAMEAGAKDFMEKPFQPEKVIEAAKKVLGEEE